MAVDLANEQSREHDVILLVVNSRVDAGLLARLTTSVRVVCLHRPEGSRNPYWLLRLLFTLYSMQPDIVHSHDSALATMQPFIAAPLILTVHDTNIELTDAAIRFSVVCCISEAVCSDVRRRYPRLNLRQVNNGVMISTIATRSHNQSDCILGIQVSRLVHEKKGQDLVIRALAIVNSENDLRRLKIDFVGEGPSIDYLRALAIDVGVAQDCQFLGAMSRDDIYKNLCNYDILIQPSRYEGFGLTVAEGMAAEVAVVVSNAEGPMEIIGAGKFGHAFKTNDMESLAATLRKVMRAIDTPESTELLISAHKHVAETYDLVQTSRRYCEIYKEISSG